MLAVGIDEGNRHDSPDRDRHGPGRTSRGRMTSAPAPGAFERPDRSGQDGLACLEPSQILGQGNGQESWRLAGILLQALQGDDLDIARQAWHEA